MTTVLDVPTWAAPHSPDELGEIEHRLCRVLQAEPDVRWAYLCGSAARGEPFRDIDVALMLAPTARGAVALGRVVARLEAATAPLRADVIDLAAAAPLLAARVAREGRVLVDCDVEARRAWEIDANSRGLDFEPWQARFEQLRDEALRQRVG